MIWGGTDAGHVGVDAEQLRWGQYAHLVDDDRPPVAPCCHELLVAEPLHQLDPRRGNVDQIPACGARLAREPVPREGRNDHMERILGLAAERGGVSERTDEIEQLDDRSGPAVGDDQRQGALVTRRDVDEVDVEIVDIG